MAELTKIYKNIENGICIEITEDLLVCENLNGTIVSFIINNQSSPDVFVDNLNITKSPTNENRVSFEMFLSYSIKDLKKYIDNFILLENERFEIKEYETKKLVYTGEINGKKLKWLQVMMNINRSVYVLTYSAKIDSFDDNLVTIQEIISTFRFV